jgi:hypothetical protein
VAKKKKNKKKNKTKLMTWEEFCAEMPVDEYRAAAYARMMDAEERLYQLWEQRNTEMTWIGEAIGSPMEEERTLWVTELGEKVALLGGHLELIAVLPDETVMLMREPEADDQAQEAS